VVATRRTASHPERGPLEDADRPVPRRHHEVEIAVAVEIGRHECAAVHERQARCGRWQRRVRDAAARSRPSPHTLFLGVGGRGGDLPVRHDEVGLAVEIEVLERAPPADLQAVRGCRLCRAAPIGSHDVLEVERRGPVGEGSVSRSLEQQLPPEVRDEVVGDPIAGDVLGDDAHARAQLADERAGHGRRDVLEPHVAVGARALVGEEVILVDVDLFSPRLDWTPAEVVDEGVVGDVEVQPPVAIEVRRRDRPREAECVEAEAPRDVQEGPVALVAVERVRPAAGVGLHLEPEVGDVDVEEPIAVQVGA
jgi:hypothetical protein